jgi:hypothetical protein
VLVGLCLQVHVLQHPDRIMSMFGQWSASDRGKERRGVSGLTGAGRERTDLLEQTRSPLAASRPQQIARPRPGVAVGDQISDGSVWHAPLMPELLVHTTVNGHTDLNARM